MKPRSRRAAVLAAILMAAGAAAFFSTVKQAAGRGPAEGFRRPEGSRAPVPAESMTPEFQKAIRLFQDPTPERRAEGERLLRAMGDRGIAGLRAWIARSETDVDRARALLASLGGESPSDDLLAEARPFLLREVADAWTKYHAGEYRGARRKAEAVLALDPESPEMWQVRRLLRLCDDRLVSKEVLEATAEFRSLVYTVDEVPRILFRLVNRSKGPVTIEADRGILGNFKVTFDRRFLDGSERTDERTVPIRTADGEGTIVIEAGESYKREVVVYLGEPKPESGMVLRVRAEGKFQPAVWEAEGKNYTRVVPMSTAECWVVGASERNLSDAPLRKIESALFFRDLHGLFTAGHLAVWACEDEPLLNEKLLRLLIDALKDLDGTGVRVADSILCLAGGFRREPREAPAEAVTEFWRRWWSERKAREKEAKGTAVPLPKVMR
jgi:hypothetical protein